MGFQVTMPAFDRPGGEGRGAPRARLVDLSHLSRQTMGDRDIEQEVLALFAHQAAAVAEEIEAADVGERLRLAHGLKGSARGVGAFPIADCAEELEKHPQDKAVVGRLRRLIAETRDFIAAISR